MCLARIEATWGSPPAARKGTDHRLTGESVDDPVDWAVAVGLVAARRTGLDGAS